MTPTLMDYEAVGVELHTYTLGMSLTVAFMHLNFNAFEY